MSQENDLEVPGLLSLVFMFFGIWIAPLVAVFWVFLAPRELFWVSFVILWAYYFNIARIVDAGKEYLEREKDKKV